MTRLDKLSKQFNWLVKTSKGVKCTYCNSEHDMHYMKLKKKNGLGDWYYNKNVYQCPSCRNWFPAKKKVRTWLNHYYTDYLYEVFHLIRIEYHGQPVVRTYRVEKRWNGSAEYNVSEIARDAIDEKIRETKGIVLNFYSAYYMNDAEYWRTSTRGMKHFVFNKQVLDYAHLKKTRYKYFPLTKVARYHERKCLNICWTETLQNYNDDYELLAKLGFHHLVGTSIFKNDLYDYGFTKSTLKHYGDVIKRNQLYPADKHLLGYCKTKRHFDTLKRIAKTHVDTIKAYCNVDRAVNYIQGLNNHKIQLWIDYLEMRNTLSMNITKYPKDVEAKHNELDMIKEAIDTQRYDEMIKKRYPNYVILNYCNKIYCLEPFESAMDLIKEGNSLHHCVRQKHYIEGYAKGHRILMKLRRIDRYDDPYITVEIRDGKLIQARGMYNEPAEGDVRKFIDQFEKEVLDAHTTVG